MTSDQTSGQAAQPGEPEEIDPVISDAVHHVSNRFGTQGLCDLIALAREELARAESALKDLSELD